MARYKCKMEGTRRPITVFARDMRNAINAGMRRLNAYTEGWSDVGVKNGRHLIATAWGKMEVWDAEQD